MSEIPSAAEIVRLLAPYRIELVADAVEQLRTYLELLMRWNQRMSLTAVRDAKEMVQELFGESLLLASQVRLEGDLVDIGSGAGFPGLALKLAAPDLQVTLLESNRRKCTFLKEVIRRCGFERVEVVSERFESWSGPETGIHLITTRAVAQDDLLLGWVEENLAEGGFCALFVTMDVVSELVSRSSALRFDSPIAVPQSERRIILIGRKS